MFDIYLTIISPRSNIQKTSPFSPPFPLIGSRLLCKALGLHLRSMLPTDSKKAPWKLGQVTSINKFSVQVFHGWIFSAYPLKDHWWKDMLPTCQENAWHNVHHMYYRQHELIIDSKCLGSACTTKVLHHSLCWIFKLSGLDKVKMWR